jgi:hypothetical protein
MWLLFVVRIMYSGLKVQEKLAKYCPCCCKSRKTVGSYGGDKVGLNEDESDAVKVKGKKGTESAGKMVGDIEMASVHISNPLLPLPDEPGSTNSSPSQPFEGVTGKRKEKGPNGGEITSTKGYSKGQSDRVMINPVANK